MDNGITIDIRTPMLKNNECKNECKIFIKDLCNLLVPITIIIGSVIGVIYIISFWQ